MSDPTASEPDLTRNQAMVLRALSDAEGPLSAYAILDLLREDGLRAPPQVYRALEKLVERGMVHRLESLNAFVACRHPACADHAMIAFMICEVCGTVVEIDDPSLADQVTGLAADRGFELHKTTIELRGRCRACRQ